MLQICNYKDRNVLNILPALSTQLQMCVFFAGLPQQCPNSAGKIPRKDGHALLHRHWQVIQ
jgi:hypothetical protein